MFVITADQIDSRNDRDRAGELITELTTVFGGNFVLPPDQTSGDEIQVLLTDAPACVDVILAIHRTGHWTIGLGVGEVRRPLAVSTRQSAGDAFVSARDAVTRAKRADARFALTSPASEHAAPVLSASEVEAVFAMLLLVRQRRTKEGWQAVDLLQTGRTQAEVAAELDISTAAVSQRLKAALWRTEESVRPALARLLENLDRVTSEMEPAA
ncbi:MAG TPA: DNA-binding protein [Glaciibacter sp.]|nr:DNA-binding protein [Glaciibacter sp.]